MVSPSYDLCMIPVASDLCASFQAAVGDVLADRTGNAIDTFQDRCSKISD